jgi:hypothetical protein
MEMVSAILGSPLDMDQSTRGGNRIVRKTIELQFLPPENHPESDGQITVNFTAGALR